MTGKELIKWIEEHDAENEVIYYTDRPIEMIDWELVKTPNGMYTAHVIMRTIGGS